MTFWQTFLERPQALWVRRALFQIHLWIGVLLSLYIMAIALTGSILVFRSELTTVQLPKALSSFDAHHVAPIKDVVQNFNAAYPGAKIATLQTPSQEVPAYFLFASDVHKCLFTAVADPTTGKLWQQPKTWLDWIYDLHAYLLLGPKYGMQVNGIGAAGLLLLTFTGLTLWWPGIQRWTRRLAIDFTRNWRRINYDAHNAIGFWILCIVFWWGFSGCYFAWYRQVTTIVAHVFPLQAMVAPKLPILPVSSSRRATLEEVLTSVRQTSPHGRLFSLSDPMLSSDVAYALVDLRAAGDFSHRDIIAISTADARVLTVWHYGQNESIGDWVLWAMHPLHYGTLWGLPFKVLWSLLGVGLALLAVTGLLMYWNRFLRRRLRSRKTDKNIPESC